MIARSFISSSSSEQWTLTKPWSTGWFEGCVLDVSLYLLLHSTSLHPPHFTSLDTHLHLIFHFILHNPTHMSSPLHPTFDYTPVYFSHLPFFLTPWITTPSWLHVSNYTHLITPPSLQLSHYTTSSLYLILYISLYYTSLYYIPINTPLSLYVFFVLPSLHLSLDTKKMS